MRRALTQHIILSPGGVVVQKGGTLIKKKEGLYDQQKITRRVIYSADGVIPLR